ncbi:hypothetical protein KJ713_00445 [Patescibacteria group bacterium]|nr:hypothetical protein [Patescibacteria group bacterium]
MEITKQDLKKQTEDIKRHNAVLYEKFEGKIDIISEGWDITKEKVDATFEMVGKLNEKTDGLSNKADATLEMVGEMKIDMEVVKSDISFIKNSLKQKVDKDEFISLEKRVILLENKLKRV